PTKTPTKTASGSAGPSGSGGASGGGGGVPGAPGGGGAANACYKQSTQQPVTLQVGQVGGKEALTDGNGCAVYLNNQDTQQSSACDSTCVATWPPVKGPGQAGTGVDQTNLSTFNRDDGTQQVTYF